MNTSTLSDIAEITSSIAILVTLVFLVIQMQQNTQAIQTQTRQSLLEGQQSELLARLDHPEIITSMVKNGPLTPTESARIHTWLTAAINARFFVWTQYQSGLVDEQVWAGENRVLRTFFSTATNREWWNKIGKFIVAPAFAIYVDALLEDQPLSEDLYKAILTWTEN